MMIQMNMGGGYDEMTEAMLNIREPLGESRPVVIVNQGEGAGGLGLFGLAGDRFIDQSVAKKLPNGLRPRSEFAVGTEPIETLKQIRFQRDGETRDFRHSPPPAEAIHEKN
jgi:hypothetical protein